MVISYLSNDKVSIKTKTDTITIGNGVQIGQYSITDAGEYDVSAIQCESAYLAKATVYFLRTEDLTITFLSEIDTEVTKLDDASKSNILIIDLRSDANVDQLKLILKGLEPAYLLLIGAGSTPEFADSLGLPKYDSSTLKVTSSGLPLEGTYLIPSS